MLLDSDFDNDIMIRDVEHKDYDFYVQNIRDINNEEFMIYLDYIKENSNEKTFVFVDNCSERPIAFCDISIITNYFGTRGVVEHFFCEPGYFGIEKEMVTRLINYAKDKSCNTFSLRSIEI